jgi:hypothetical protein
MDAILDLPRDLPQHDSAPLSPVSARTVCEWPTGTFVENLCPLADGSFAVSVLSEARLDQVWPDGRRKTLVQFPAPPTGLVRQGQALFVAVGLPDKAPWTLWRVDLVDHSAEPLFEVAGATFLNGLAWFASDVLLAAEAAEGAILRLDVAGRQASPWLRDERLSRAPQAPFLPGANGIKVFDGGATISSNGRALLLRAPIRADGSAGPLETVAERVRVDDFAFDADGDCYLCTHIGHSVDRLSRDGARASLGGPAQGLAGSTACAFGLGWNDRDALFVTTTGGIIGPVGGVLQPAKLVRLAVGAPGASLGGDRP